MDYAEIIKSGTIQQLREFTFVHFHKIKHTESFGLILNRIEETEGLLKAAQHKIKVAEKSTHNTGSPKFCTDYSNHELCDFHQHICNSQNECGHKTSGNA